MHGILVAAVSQTIVSLAMPVIVTELGDTEHYSYIAASVLLVSAVTAPAVASSMGSAAGAGSTTRGWSSSQV